MKLALEVPASPLRQRIDRYLTEALGGEFSRREIKAFIEKGAILLNGRKARPKTIVKQGDRIGGNVESGKEFSLKPEAVPLRVIYEDESLLVIDKPAGMVVHPGAGHKEGTLVHALLGRGSPLSSVGGAVRPGIVHRLDKETSGLLLVAKTNRTHRRLEAQFESRSLAKTYTALVKGIVEFDEGHVSEPIGRHPKLRKKMAVSQSDTAREAQTRYRVRRRFLRSTLLDVKLLTGRTHQIRVHLAHIGHPVIGDSVYGDKNAAVARMALHAAKIEFTHPETGKIMRFESPLPADFAGMLKTAEDDPTPSFKATQYPCR